MTNILDRLLALVQPKPSELQRRVLGHLGWDDSHPYVLDYHKKNYAPLNQIVRAAYSLSVPPALATRYREDGESEWSSMPDLIRRLVPAMILAETDKPGCLDDIWSTYLMYSIYGCSREGLNQHLEVLRRLPEFGTKYPVVLRHVREEMVKLLYHPPEHPASSVRRTPMTIDHYEFAAAEGLLREGLSEEERQKLTENGVSMHARAHLEELLGAIPPLPEPILAANGVAGNHEIL